MTLQSRTYLAYCTVPHLTLNVTRPAHEYIVWYDEIGGALFSVKMRKRSGEFRYEVDQNSRIFYLHSFSPKSFFIEFWEASRYISSFPTLLTGTHSSKRVPPTLKPSSCPFPVQWNQLQEQNTTWPSAKKKSWNHGGKPVTNGLTSRVKT